MADDSLNERLLRAATHICALAAVGFAARAAMVTRGWVRVPAADTLHDPPLLSVIVPARNEERTIAR